ncbi:MAG: septal ring lytic transglycosylase RlpA family protein [Candidatus Acidiferrales bacterium]
MSSTPQLARRLLLAGLVLLLVLGAGGCRRKRRVVAPPPPPAAEGEVETGLASWYGHPYHGRQTSSGEVYDMNAMTAAHRTLPFGTWVMVTNLENQQFTEVRINDRGPFIEGRIIDLSRAAAEAISMIGPGTALVRLDIVSRPEAPAAAANYSVQVGAFRDRANAYDLQSQLAKKYGDVFMQEFDAPDGAYYRVRVGRLASYDEAVALARQLGREPNVGIPMVVRLN